MKALSYMLGTLGAAIVACVFYLYATAGADLTGLVIAMVGGLTAWLIGLWPVYRRMRPYRYFGWPGQNRMGLRERCRMAGIWPADYGCTRAQIVRGVLTRWWKDVREVVAGRRSLRGFL